MFTLTGGNIRLEFSTSAPCTLLERAIAQIIKSGNDHILCGCYIRKEIQGEVAWLNAPFDHKQNRLSWEAFKSMTTLYRPFGRPSYLGAVVSVSMNCNSALATDIEDDIERVQFSCWCLTDVQWIVWGKLWSAEVTVWKSFRVEAREHQKSPISLTSITCWGMVPTLEWKEVVDTLSSTLRAKNGDEQTKKTRNETKRDERDTQKLDKRVRRGARVFLHGF